MGQIELIGIALALSMDAFAVSVCKGLGMKKINYSQALTIGLFFGGFQALMPLLGWLLGSRFESYIRAFDHWVAFGLWPLSGANDSRPCEARTTIVRAARNSITGFVYGGRHQH